MSVYSMNSSDLIASIKRRAMIPTNQATFKDEDFLAFATEEMYVGLVPMILRMHEDYLLYTETVAIQDNSVRYTIPYRAIGDKLREISFQDSAGNVYEMTRIGVGDLPYYNFQSYNRPYAFYIENNEIVLAPGATYNTVGTSLRISYYMSPNALVTLNDVAPITSIDRSTGVIQVDNLPVNFNVNKLLDLISNKSSNKTLDYDIQPLAVNSTSKTITFNVEDIPVNLNIGDHISLATETALVQVPKDLHVILAHRTAMRCLEALGDTEGLASGNQKLGEMVTQAEVLIDNRVDDAPRKITNRHSILRGGSIGRRGRFR